MSDPHSGIDAGADRRPPWQATVLTLFPEMFPGSLGLSLAGKALAAERWDLQTVNIRDYALNRHRSVDDTAFGGGSGMVMRADVVAAAIDAVAALTSFMGLNALQLDSLSFVRPECLLQIVAH